MQQKSPQLAIFLHAAESAGVTAILTFLIGLVQYIGLHGLNWAELGTVAALIFAGAFSQFYKSLSTNPNAGPALIEAISELRSSHSYLGGLISQLYNAVTTQAPVVPPQDQQTAAPLQSSVVPGVTLTPTPPNSSAIVAESIPPTGTFTTVQQQTPPTRDAWSNSALMQAIGKPTQQQ